MDRDPSRRPLYRSLYFQVITAIVIGVLLGHFYPQTGEAIEIAESTSPKFTTGKALKERVAEAHKPK